MSELYLTLVSGRTVHVCSDWDGAAPTRIGTIDLLARIEAHNVSPGMLALSHKLHAVTPPHG